MKMTKDERETIVIFSDAEKTAWVSTCSLPMMNKLDKLCETCPEIYKRVEVLTDTDGDLYCKRYKIENKKFISFRKPVKMSDEAKAASAERLRRARNG